MNANVGLEGTGAGPKLRNELKDLLNVCHTRKKWCGLGRDESGRRSVQPGITRRPLGPAVIVMIGRFSVLVVVGVRCETVVMLRMFVRDVGVRVQRRGKAGHFREHSHKAQRNEAPHERSVWKPGAHVKSTAS